MSAQSKRDWRWIIVKALGFGFPVAYAVSWARFVAASPNEERAIAGGLPAVQAAYVMWNALYLFPIACAFPGAAFLLEFMAGKRAEVG